MTTFQALVESFMQAITLVLPLSSKLDDFLAQNILLWNFPKEELELWVGLMGSIAALIFFRYDWLGLLSAFIRSITDPKSLRSDRRSLDQHTLLFMILVIVPLKIAKHFLHPLLLESGLDQEAYLLFACSIATGFGFWFSRRWNKRIHGLNHIKLKDALIVGGIALFAVLPGFPLLGLLWIGFAMANYHYEAIFKYSFMLLSITIFVHTIHLMTNIGTSAAVAQIGHLNSVAAAVIAYSVFWMSMENLQKNLAESSFRLLQWVSGAVGIFFLATHWIKG